MDVALDDIFQQSAHGGTHQLRNQARHLSMRRHRTHHGNLCARLPNWPHRRARGKLGLASEDNVVPLYSTVGCRAGHELNPSFRFSAHG